MQNNTGMTEWLQLNTTMVPGLDKEYLVTSSAILSTVTVEYFFHNATT